MRATLGLILLCAVAVVADDTNGHTEVMSICSRDECTCREKNGLQRISCDCGEADGDAKALTVGAAPDTSLPVGTVSLRVHRCSAVSLVSKALVNASRLADLELSAIGRLKLRPGSLHRAGDGPPPLRLTVQRVADLRLHPEAFQQVGRLEQVEFTEVVSGSLLLHRLVDASGLMWFRLTDSQSGDVRLSLNTVHSVTVTNCTMDSLNIAAAAVRSVTIADNTFLSLDELFFNSIEDPKKANGEVIIERNTISEVTEDRLRMTLHRLIMLNNTIGNWTAPLQGTYHIAVFTGNDISRLGDGVFSMFARVTDRNLDRHWSIMGNIYHMTFSHNIVRGSHEAAGLNGSFLAPSDAGARYMALFRVTGNRFTCVCPQLDDLVKTAEQRLNSPVSVVPNKDGLYVSGTVHVQLYRTSSCLQDGRSLQQYRQDAYTDQLECFPNGAAAAAAAVGALILLLAIAAIST